MGKRRFWDYCVEVWCEGTFFTPACWRIGKQGESPGNGRSSAPNLGRWVRLFEASLQEEPYKKFKFGPIVRARIIHQETGIVVAEWRRAGSGFVQLARRSRTA